MSRDQTNRIDTQQLENDFPIESVVERYCGPPSRCGGELLFTCPFGNHSRKKLALNQRKGVWRCFACSVGGTGSIAFVMKVRSLKFRDACAELAGDVANYTESQITLGRSRREQDRRVQAEQRAQDESRAQEAKRVRAVSIWGSGHRLSSGCADAERVLSYLRGRGLDPSFLSNHLISLRGLGGCPLSAGLPTSGRAPAMVAGIQVPMNSALGCEPSAPVQAIHRTYLASNGSSKIVPTNDYGLRLSASKQMLGPCRGGAVRFGPPAQELYLSEGIETGLSVLQALLKLGRDPSRFSVWAVLSLGGFRAVQLPDEAKLITLCGDGDGADGQKFRPQLEVAAQHHLVCGRRVKIAFAPPGQDFNDVLQK